jgi:hypothetical protein
MISDLLPKVGLLAMFGVAAPVGGGDAGAWAQWGLAGVVVGFTLWRDQVREARMGSALDRQQAWIRDTLTKALTQNTTALHDVRQALLGDHKRGRSLTAEHVDDLQAVAGEPPER